MSIKFRPNDLVVLNITHQFSDDVDVNGDVNVDIEIGPIINRVRCGWSTYCPITSEHDNIINAFRDRISSSSTSRIVIEYREFKTIIKEFKAVELLDRFRPFSIEDMRDDLDFIKDELTHVKIQMNIMKQKNEIEKYNFYENLVEKNTHLMFGLPSKEKYFTYMKNLSEICNTSQKMHQSLQNAHTVSENIMWHEYKQ